MVDNATSWYMRNIHTSVEHTYALLSTCSCFHDLRSGWPFSYHLKLSQWSHIHSPVSQWPVLYTKYPLNLADSTDGNLHSTYLLERATCYPDVTRRHFSTYAMSRMSLALLMSQNFSKSPTSKPSTLESTHIFWLESCRDNLYRKGVQKLNKRIEFGQWSYAKYVTGHCNSCLKTCKDQLMQYQFLNSTNLLWLW